MKLRIKGNTIRLRLTQSEVDTFKKMGEITEHLNFGENSLKYSLKKSDKHVISASFKQNLITVHIPSPLAEKWTNSDLVGLDNTNELNGEIEGENYILVEKDFQCLHKRPMEDETDNYPHPLNT
ncbi:DUF7009 family protein [Aegicerativicinus sediminis]|uniref:DUF7009 family protein n=1 Tax=Aegicerativicinus sediminis TaxID=2893202 RepID=UPI001E557BA7|nr:hypothetical protein [Aegicerativicinus sediminis]